jgi:hypothetical protein
LGWRVMQGGGLRRSGAAYPPVCRVVSSRRMSSPARPTLSDGRLSPPPPEGPPVRDTSHCRPTDGSAKSEITQATWTLASHDTMLLATASRVPPAWGAGDNLRCNGFTCCALNRGGS